MATRYFFFFKYCYIRLLLILHQILLLIFTNRLYNWHHHCGIGAWQRYLMFQFHENLLQFILVKQGYKKTKSKYSFLSPKSTTAGAMYSQSNFGWFVNRTKRSQRCPNTISFSFFLLSQESRCRFTSRNSHNSLDVKLFLLKRIFLFKKLLLLTATHGIWGSL